MELDEFGAAWCIKKPPGLCLFGHSSMFPHACKQMESSEILDSKTLQHFQLERPKKSIALLLDKHCRILGHVFIIGWECVSNAKYDLSEVVLRCVVEEEGNSLISHFSPAPHVFHYSQVACFTSVAHGATPI